jgi:Fur family transcriptional regulator, peroxide stress response regulator
MEKILKILKERDIRGTHQRLAVYKVLSQERRHFTAEEIYERVKPENPAVSLATVYTILDLFKGKGLVNEIRIRFDKSCFEARIDSHHHFLCKKCDSIVDVDMKVCQGLKNKEIQGHQIESMQGYFYGTCQKCRKS